jgi:hypothetical protein
MLTKDEVAALSLRVQGEKIANVDEYWDYSDESAIKVFTIFPYKIL